MIDRVVRYWLYGRFYQQLAAMQLSPVGAQVPPECVDWIAPFVYGKGSQTIIPLWLPTSGLPYIAPTLFDPLGPYPILTEPLHVFDQWLRFEWTETTGHQSEALLDQLSEGQWQQRLDDLGFKLIAKDVDFTGPSFEGTMPLNALQQQFAQFFDEEEALPELESCGWTVTPFTRGDPAQNRCIEKTRLQLLSENKSVMMLRWDPRRDRVRFYKAQQDQNEKWVEREGMRACHLLIIADAERFFPHAIFPYLGMAQQALFLGDPNAITPFPIVTGYQDACLLEQVGLADDGIQEELQYRGMGISTGNALRLAMTHPLVGSPFHASTLVGHGPAKVWFVDQAGQSMQGQYNPQQATGLVQWLQVQIHRKVIDPKEAIIVTLFKMQQQYLRKALADCGITCDVRTVYQIPAKRVKNVIFSTVYTVSDARPFLFDVGDAIFYQLQAAASQVLWIVGDTAIFDNKCHSPSGKIAKQWMTEPVLSESLF